MAEPLDRSLINDIENGTITPNMDQNERSLILTEKHGWDMNETFNILDFGPDHNGANILIDSSSSIQNIDDVRDYLETAFQWVTSEGALADEKTLGIKYTILDISLHSEAVNRKGAQIIPMARRAYVAAQLSAGPSFLEPVYLCEILAPEDAIGDIHSIINQRRGIVFGEEPSHGSTMKTIKAYLPVAESFGFGKILLEATCGRSLFT